MIYRRGSIPQWGIFQMGGIFPAGLPESQPLPHSSIVLNNEVRAETQATARVIFTAEYLPLEKSPRR